MEHEDRLRGIVCSDQWFMSILRAVREAALPQWAVAAGVIRNIVWDHMHGYDQPSPLKDVDVAFWDQADVSRERDRAIEEGLRARLPNVPWEVTNQAGVHLWYERKFGYEIPAITSLEDGVSRNPERATSVAVRLEADDALTVIAPYGLDDLFGLILRRNPKQVTREYFLQRLREKRIQERWPRVTVIDE